MVEAHCYIVTTGKHLKKAYVVETSYNQLLLMINSATYMLIKIRVPVMTFGLPQI